MRRGAPSVHSSSGSSSSSDTDDGDEPPADVARRGGGGLVPAAAYGRPLTYTDESSSSSSSSSSSDGEETTTQLSFEETTDRKQEPQAEDTATFVHHATSSDDEEEEEDVTAVTATATTATTQEPEEQTEPSQQKRAKKKAKGGEPKRKEKEIDNKKERTRGGDLIKEGYALSGHGNGSRQRWSRRSSVSKRRLLSSNVKKQRVLLRQPSLEDTPIYYLCLAVREGNLDDVQNLLDNAKDKSLVNQRCFLPGEHTAKNNYSPMSYTPLQYAIKYDQPEILQYLMEKKADPRIKSLEHVFEDDDGMIPNTNSSSSLITKNRSKRDVASDDTTYLSKVESRNAFHIAAQFGRSELLEAILTFKEYDDEDLLAEDHYHTVMSLAIKNKCGPEIARVLHDFNYDISGIPTEGTPEWETYNTVTKRSKRATLLYAVKRCDDVGFIRFLISNARQDVNMRTYKMTTPTHMAAKYGASKILRYLIKKGALVDPLNATQETPLCKSLETYYQSRAKLEAVQELEPYHLAKAKKFYREAIETTNHLLDCKATLKFARTSAGTSPLYYIVDKNLRPFIKHKRVQQELKAIWRLNMKFSYTWWTQNWWHMLTHPKTQFWLSFFAYFLFLILLTVLMLLTNTDMHTEAYYFESSIRVRTVGEEFLIDHPLDSRTGSPGFFRKYFAGIDQTSEIWAWITGPLWLNFFVPETSFIMNYNRVVTNKMQLRQFRVEPGSCSLATDDYQYLARNGECYGAYSREEGEEQRSFGPGQGEGWTYESPSDSGAFISALEELFPERGGYKVTLDTRDANATYDKIQELINNNWIDEQTRGVFLEFAIYNPNINLFCVIRLTWDMPRSGIVYPSSDFLTIKLFRYVAVGDWVELTFEIILSIWFLFYLFLECKKLWKQKKRYFQNITGWQLLDYSFFLCFLVLGIFRFIEIGIVASIDWEADDTQYVSFNRLARYRGYQLLIISFIFVLGWLRLFKYLRIHHDIGVLLRVISRMINAIVVWGCVFFAILISFSLALFLLLGSKEWDYRSTYWAMVKTALQDQAYGSLTKDQNFGAIILYLCFTVISGTMLLNLLIALLSESYVKVIDRATLEYLLNVAQLILSYTNDPVKGERFKRLVRKSKLITHTEEHDFTSDDSDMEMEEMATTKSRASFVPIPPPPAIRRRNSLMLWQSDVGTELLERRERTSFTDQVEEAEGRYLKNEEAVNQKEGEEKRRSRGGAGAASSSQRKSHNARHHRNPSFQFLMPRAGSAIFSGEKVAPTMHNVTQREAVLNYHLEQLERKLTNYEERTQRKLSKILTILKDQESVDDDF